MKRLLIILCMGLGLQLMAQPAGRPRLEKAKQKIETMHAAFITDRLNLNPEEARKFWPIYDQYKDEEKQIRQDMRPDKMPADMSEKEAEQFIIERFSSQERQLALDKKYYARLKEVISVRKIAALFQAEKEFKLKLVEVMKNRKNARMGGKPELNDGF